MRMGIVGLRKRVRGDVQVMVEFDPEVFTKHIQECGWEWAAPVQNGEVQSDADRRYGMNFIEALNLAITVRRK